MTRPRSSDQLLRAIGAAGDPGISLERLDDQVDLNRKSIRNAVGLLNRRGLVERLEPGTYRLSHSGKIALESGESIKPGPGPQGLSVARRYPKCLRAKLWRAMRQMRKFGIDDLLLRAAQGSEADARNNAGKYVSALERCGYLQRLKHRLPGDASTSNGFVRWLLVRNSGPLAPVWQTRKGVMFDPNTQESFPLGALTDSVWGSRKADTDNTGGPHD